MEVHIKFAPGNHVRREIFYLQSNQRAVELEGYISISSLLLCKGGIPTPCPYTGWGMEIPDAVGIPSRGVLVLCLLKAGRLVPLDGSRIRSYKMFSASDI